MLGAVAAATADLGIRVDHLLRQSTLGLIKFHGFAHGLIVCIVLELHRELPLGAMLPLDDVARRLLDQVHDIDVDDLAACAILGVLAVVGAALAVVNVLALRVHVEVLRQVQAIEPVAMRIALASKPFRNWWWWWWSRWLQRCSLLSEGVHLPRLEQGCQWGCS